MSSFDDWRAVNSLLMQYAHRVDSGDWAAVGALFEHATYRIEHAGVDRVSEYFGSQAVVAFCEQVRLYDGSPRTRHVITNVDIVVDGDFAKSSCYATVLQQTSEFPLQPIASGCYVDRFERADGVWRFADRLLTGFLLGDRSHHVLWHEGAPA